MLQNVLRDQRHNYYSISFLSKLYQFQQDGYLCDVTVVSCDGEEVVAHAGVLAAVISEFRDKLVECTNGYYTIETNLTMNEILVLIHFAYTGTIMSSNLGDYTQLCLSSEIYTDVAHENKILRALDEFTNKGWFCNMAWENEFSEMKPVQTYIMAAKYNFLACDILNQNRVKVLSTIIPQNCVYHSDHSYCVIQTSGNTGTGSVVALTSRHDKFSSKLHNSELAVGKTHSVRKEGDVRKSENLITVTDIQTSYICDKCEERFITKEKLKDHEQIHRNAKFHIAVTREPGFPPNWQMADHERIHRKTKPLVDVTSHPQKHNALKPPARAACRLQRHSNVDCLVSADHKQSPQRSVTYQSHQHNHVNLVEAGSSQHYQHKCHLQKHNDLIPLASIAVGFQQENVVNSTVSVAHQPQQHKVVHPQERVKYQHQQHKVVCPQDSFMRLPQQHNDLTPLASITDGLPQHDAVNAAVSASHNGVNPQVSVKCQPQQHDGVNHQKSVICQPQKHSADPVISVSKI